MRFQVSSPFYNQQMDPKSDCLPIFRYSNGNISSEMSLAILACSWIVSYRSTDMPSDSQRQKRASPSQRLEAEAIALKNEVTESLFAGARHWQLQTFPAFNLHPLTSPTCLTGDGEREMFNLLLCASRSLCLLPEEPKMTRKHCE